MKTEIASLTIVNQQGTNSYHVGSVYNGLLLDHIEDRSMEYENSIEFIYVGVTEDDSFVFVAINVPIDVAYIKGGA